MTEPSNEERSPYANDPETARANSAMATARKRREVPKRTGETLRKAAQKKLVARKYAANRRLAQAEARGDVVKAAEARERIAECERDRERVKKGAVDWEFIFELMPDDRPDEPVPAVREKSPLEALADDLLLEVGFLQEVEALIAEKSQIIFQGPPGTGKTFVARKLAGVLAGSSDRVRLVQFHPSYAYEDFVQGFRPTLKGDRAGFELRDGPLLDMAEQARKSPQTKYFLVIDEINRGNLAKILGELYFLLEYRDSDMRLQYSDKQFSLPSNLYIIGTMNTADRSIALVDLALRRRFSFVEFHPDTEPVNGLLRRWLRLNVPGMVWVADIVDRANEKLDDRHAAIGPSYFMRPDGIDDETVERIWEHNVLPYVEEQLYGAHDLLAEFALDHLRNEVAGTGNGDTAASGQDDFREEA